MNTVAELSPMDRTRMYVASCLSLAVGAMVFIVRGNIQETLRLDLEISNEAIGGVMGVAGLGMALTLLLSSSLCDVVGMGNLLRAACVLHLIGIPLTVLAPNEVSLKAAVFMCGLAHGFIEGSINPLIATLYPGQKTHKLNVLHAWWPGGLVIGGLAAVGLNNAGFDDPRIKFGLILIPALVYGVLVTGIQFPKTERSAAGVANATMYLQAIHPGFLLLFFCMLLTAATELGPAQWMETVLQETCKMSGTLVLVYISGLMFVMRFFAGPLAHKINPIGILCLSSIFSCIGLLGLSIAKQPVVAYAAATIFAVGVCYYWPTMLGVVAEQYPKGGAFTISLIGVAGMISIIKILPMIGAWRDQHGSSGALQRVAIIPLFLVAIFGILYAWYHVRGGYKPVVLVAEGEAAAA